MNKLTCKEIIEDFPPILDTESVIGLDLELSGLRENQLHRPAGRLVSLQGSFDGETAYIVFGEDEVAEFMRRIEKATWVYHNSTFDIGHTRRWAKVVERKAMRDTLLIERLLWSNYYTEFGLNHLVRRYLGCYMPKSVRKEFHDLEGPMTKEQIEYAALDVIGTWLVDKEQQKIISEVDKKIWNNLYNPHVWTTLELGGFKLDVDAWRDLAEKNQTIVDEISEKLGKQYGVTKTKLVGRGRNRHEESYFEEFNPNSHPQVKAILADKFKLVLESTDDDHIRPYYETNEFVKDILDYRKSEKQVSTYGLPFLKNVEGDENRIYTSLNISLAETGRDSSSSPNLQNIPKDIERRKCFVAGYGKVLVLYDYSGQEANLWAYISKDSMFKEIINAGKKLYIEVARIALGEVIVKGTPRYDVVKGVVLGLMYGLTPYGVARDYGVDLEVAEELYEKVLTAFPDTAKYIEDQQSWNRGTVKTIIGRSVHLHPYDRQWKNNTLNSPMQGSGSDMIKLAMKKIRKSEFYQKYHPEGKLDLILQVHDEIITEVVKELAEEWSVIMKQIMIEVAESLHPGIKGGVSGGIISDWSQKE